MANSKKGIKVIIAIIVVLVCLIGGIFIGINIPKIFNKENITEETKITINEQKLEEAVKNTILSLAKEQTGRLTTKNSAYAEGHVILKSEVKDDNKIYAYILTEYGKYYLNANGNIRSESASSVPLTIKFEVNSNNEYIALETKEPEDGSKYYSSIKEMFPDDIVNEEDKLHDGTYEESFNKQIETYLKAVNSEENKEESKEENKENNENNNTENNNEPIKENEPTKEDENEQNKNSESNKTAFLYEYEAVTDNYVYVIKSEKDIKEMKEVVLEIKNKSTSKTYTSKVCEVNAQGAAGTIYLPFDFELDNGIKGNAIVKVSNVVDNEQSIQVEKTSGNENIETSYQKLVCKKKNGKEVESSVKKNKEIVNSVL